MRKKIVAGNWKMNKSLQEGLELVSDLNTKLATTPPSDVDIIVGTPFIHLTEVSKAIDNKIAVAAQNCATEVSGAYTGEVSAGMVKSTGAQYIILGHSERRAYYNETDEMLVKKIDMTMGNGLTPIFCVGEVLAERENNTHFDVVRQQVEKALFHLSADAIKKVVIAYEPVWAIGTGVTASPEQAQEMHAFIRSVLVEGYGDEVAQSISILYGGSVKPGNAKDIFAKDDVDGGLIGGASLSADDFFGIVAGF